ncbi:hypothetical protein [Streptomyces sp. 6-11-2]|uniref:hypothetical protein n=1 Tax=Streptomyces sp. 6-11-2 TaxID=2585753 RepID=UPI0011447DF6|nr:hypothetical protein [Streptomyces sp. 6-11-2]GED89353.1 hypothetical protein TNCT6_64380 [Streptomyces sp. 6-11-2]
MRTPQFEGHVDPGGKLHCMGHARPTDPLCRKPATWHVAWVLAPRGHFTHLCEGHMAAAAEVYDYVDRHLTDANCGMPGTGWASGNPSFCVVVPQDETINRGHGSAT